MNADDRSELTRRMEEVVALPHDDPRRRRVMDMVESAGDWAETRWLELLREDEQLRLSLRHVNAPKGLEERLLDLPLGRTRIGLGFFRRVASLVTAVVFLAGVLLIGYASMRLQPSINDAVQHLAALTIRDHAKRPALSIKATNRDFVRVALAAEAPMNVSLPPLSSDYNMIGGRVCALGSCPIIYTRWVHNGVDHSLYQVRPEDFHLTRDFAPQMITVPATPDGRSGCTVLVWVDGTDAFVLVCDDHATDAATPPEQNRFEAIHNQSKPSL